MPVVSPLWGGAHLGSSSSAVFLSGDELGNSGAQRAAYRESIDKTEQTINPLLLGNSILLGAATYQPHLPVVRAQPIRFPGSPASGMGNPLEVTKSRRELEETPASLALSCLLLPLIFRVMHLSLVLSLASPENASDVWSLWQRLFKLFFKRVEVALFHFKWTETTNTLACAGLRRVTFRHQRPENQTSGHTNSGGSES